VEILQVRRRSLRVVALVAVLVGVGATSAQAAVTVGQTFAPNYAPGGVWTTLQSAVESGASYTMPSDGVLTSWSFQAVATAPTGIKAKVGRSAGGASYTIVAESGAENPAANVLSTFPTRIVVKAGDILGLSNPTSGPAWLKSDVPADVLQTVMGDQAPGTTTAYSGAPGYKADISAQLEADADGDGFGDETQDSCPTDPTTQAACQADMSITKTADKSSAKVGDTITYTLTATNASQSNTAKSVTITDNLPSSVTFVSATASQGSCSGTGIVTCAVGDVGKGASAVVTIVVKATGKGTATNTAAVSSATTDPGAGNNSATAVGELTDPFSGATIRAQTVKVSKKRIASVLVRCPDDTPGRCAGSLSLKTKKKVTVVSAAAKKRILKLGSKRFSIAAGKSVRVKVKLSAAAARTLAAMRKLKATATTTAKDDLGTTQKRTGTVTLKAPK
jgi:uncharacterized repeat protein (TIGR01451 family)